MLAFHLSRYSDKLAFFMIPNFNPNSTISILFKSESVFGLKTNFKFIIFCLFRKLVCFSLARHRLIKGMCIKEHCPTGIAFPV